jgi:hypothetical protein
MLSIQPQNAIALQPVDELTRASAELAAHLEEMANTIAPETNRYLFYTIRQLKRKTTELHKYYGALITKAAFGQRWSDMPKFLLSKALTKIQAILDKAPRTLKWAEVQESRRIITSRADGKVWVTLFTFKTEQEAFKFHSSILKSCRCEMAAINKSDRSDSQDYAWLVRVWGINAEVLAKLVRKDTPLAQLEYSLLESTNLDEKWAVYRPLADGQRQYLGSVRRGFSGQWSHSLQPKYGQGVPTWLTKEEAFLDLEKVFKREELSVEQARASIFSF